MIHNLVISNYKSLKHVELAGLPPLFALVGANASGKSNFLDAIDFLAHVFRDNLDSALASRGGYENVATRKARRARAPIEFSVTFESRRRPSAARYPERWITGRYWRYELAFKAVGTSIDADVRIERESLEVSDTLEGPFEVLFVRERDSFSFADETLAPRFLASRTERLNRYFEPTRAVIPTILRVDVRNWVNDFSRYRLYQVSPLVARRPSAPSREATVGRNGENLASVLRRFPKRRYAELMLLLRQAVPTMESVEADYIETKELGLFFRERGFGRRWFADDVSDGTIQAVALFVTLLSREPGVLLEEPENSLHPWILRSFVNLLREYASVDSVGGVNRKTQVFMVTHSPIALDMLAAENVYVAERTDGSTVIRCATELVDDPAGLARYLSENALGLGDSWFSGLLGGFPE